MCDRIFSVNKIYWLLVKEIYFGLGKQPHQVRSLLSVQEFSLTFNIWYHPTFNNEKMNWRSGHSKKTTNQPNKNLMVFTFTTWIIFPWNPHFCHIPNLRDVGIWRVLRASFLYKRNILALQSFILKHVKDYSPNPILCFHLLRFPTFLSLCQADKCSEIGTGSKSIL